ncbi:MAG: sigma-70 family RNA polymerase sigma factor [Oscillospiraceae bacterium]|nr:sigma-70 family RNA polymerase sigma factor [Oscillospiraceae bacterium]
MKEKNENKASRAKIDPALVAQARTGDQSAFTALYEQTHTALYRSIRSMVHDEDLAWDILQDCYLKAFQGLDKLEADGAFLTWLRRIAVNETASRMSKRLPVTFTELGDGEDETMPELPDLNPDVQPELALDRQETSRLVREILAELPEQQQLIVGMRYYEDLSVKEISDLLNLAPSTVRAQLCFGRKKVETKVRALEKQGLKLYGLAPFPFLLALLRNLEPGETLGQKALSAVLTQAPTAAGTAAAGGAASLSGAVCEAEAVKLTAMTAGQAIRHGLAAKLAAGALALCVIGGGIWAGGKALKRNNPDIGDPQHSVTETEHARPTQEPTIPTTEPIRTEEPMEQTEPIISQQPTKPAPDACGDNLTWSYNEDLNELTIKGSGPMYDYDEDENRAPWYAYHDAIESVYIPLDGDITIGSYAFCDCTALRRFYVLHSLTAIGQGAFKGCKNLSSVSCGEAESIGAEAFSGCTAMDELRILNWDCVIGTGIVDPNGTKIVGFPGSTAEQNAKENGYTFEPTVETDLDTIADLFRQDKEANPFDRKTEYSMYRLSQHPLELEGIDQVGTRCLAKVVQASFVTLTEEEMEPMLANARQTGKFVLNGVEYAYAASADELEKWGWGPWGSNDNDEVYGWLWSESDQKLYEILKYETLYCFGDYTLYVDQCFYWMDETTEIGWVWVEDVPLSPYTIVYSDICETLGEIPLKFRNYRYNGYFEPPYCRTIWFFDEGENGELSITYYAAGH